MSIYSEKISLRYNKINILENIDIEIKKGEILSILGPNGAGKSSLLNILSGSIAVSYTHLTLPTTEAV